MNAGDLLHHRYGAIGSAIARQFAAKGISVTVANTRGPESLRDYSAKLGGAITPVELSEALKADVVILAVPFQAVESVLSSHRSWDGRIIVDATNAIDPRTFGAADLGGRPSTAVVAGYVPGAAVVKGFNHILARILARAPDDGRGSGRRTLFVSGEERAAKAVVSDLMQKLGFAVIDLGKLAEGGLLQQYSGPLTGHSLMMQKTVGSNFADMDIEP